MTTREKAYAAIREAMKLAEAGRDIGGSQRKRVTLNAIQARYIEDCIRETWHTSLALIAVAEREAQQWRERCSRLEHRIVELETRPPLAWPFGPPPAGLDITEHL